MHNDIIFNELLNIRKPIPIEKFIELSLFGKKLLAMEALLPLQEYATVQAKLQIFQRVLVKLPQEQTSLLKVIRVNLGGFDKAFRPPTEVLLFL